MLQALAIRGYEYNNPVLVVSSALVAEEAYLPEALCFPEEQSRESCAGSAVAGFFSVTAVMLH